FLFAWPNARISVMGAEQAASVLASVRRDNIEAAGETWSARDEEAFKQPIRAAFETEGSPYYATARLWDDGVILPEETRRVLGLAPALDSYLRIDRILEAALRAGVDCLHPGYGFLSEHPGLAEACAEAGIVFVGPPAAAIRAMGLKHRAKELVAAAGVPVVPGY